LLLIRANHNKTQERGARTDRRIGRMLYLLHEVSQFMLTPARMAAGLTRLACESPLNPLTYTLVDGI
jgi:hypothetical protein